MNICYEDVKYCVIVKQEYCLCSIDIHCNILVNITHLSRHFTVKIFNVGLLHIMDTKLLILE